MDKNNLFSIGDVAKMFHLSVGSLRHYEALGLLQPQYVDPQTNYRYYSVRQFEVLNTICYLRVLDMPLSQIADFLKNRDPGVMEEMLSVQRKAVQKKQQKLQRILRKIDNRLSQLQDARTSRLDEISLALSPACRMVQMEDSLRIRDFLDMEVPIRRLEAAGDGSKSHIKGADAPEAVVFLGKVGIGISPENLCKGRFDTYDRIFLVLDEEDRYQGRVEEQPETMCVSVCFCGSHGEAPAQYERLMAYIRNRQLQVTGCSREITMIDYGMTSDPDKFVTRIQIPVRRAE